MNRYETKGWEPSMKKLCCLLLSLMTAVCFFSGCQGKKDITIDVSALADDLKAAVSFEDELAAPNDTAFLKSRQQRQHHRCFSAIATGRTEQQPWNMILHLFPPCNLWEMR